MKKREKKTKESKRSLQYVACICPCSTEVCLDDEDDGLARGECSDCGRTFELQYDIEPIFPETILLDCPLCGTEVEMEKVAEGEYLSEICCHKMTFQFDKK